MRVLVTGGAGFLGSHICDALLAEGHNVIGIDNLLTGSETNLAHLAHEPRFELRIADICRPLDPGPVDYVFHLAAPASPADYLRYGVETLKTGSIGTFHVLEVARKYHAKFLITSTADCYGDPLDQPQREDHRAHVNPVGPRSVYDEAKLFSEATTVAYQRYYGVDTRIARVFNTYGPRLRLDEGRVVSKFMIQALRGEPLTVYGDGSQTRTFCYVSDQIDGILRLSRSDEHGPVNLGHPTEYTMLECAQLVSLVTGSPSNIVFEPLPGEESNPRRPDITKARRLLGWEPKIDFETGLKLCVEDFRARLQSACAAPPLKT